MATPTTGPESTGIQNSPQMAWPAQSAATPAETPKGRNTRHHRGKHVHRSDWLQHQ